MAPRFSNKLFVISLIINVIFIVLIFIYVSRNKESLTQKFVWRFNTETLIMFGDSHTANGTWNKILDRCDVLTVGYGGLTSDQLKIVMQQEIVDRNASYCFIQCGGNDLGQPDFNPNRMMDNLEWMINYLKDQNIEPVLQSLFHRPNQIYNLKIDSLNIELNHLASRNNVDFINVNLMLNENNNIQEHVLYDKIHLNERGYEIWGRVVQDYLLEIDID